MSITAIIEKGAIKLPKNIPWKSGTVVRIEPVEEPPPTLLATLKEFDGMADDLPADLAANLDHYIHGHSPNPFMKKLFIAVPFFLLPFLLVMGCRNTIESPQDSYSQMLLGHKYDHGEGVEKNKERAIYWYTKAAKGGNLDAMHYLANILDENPVTTPEAISWYEKALATPDIEAYYKEHLLQDLNYAQYNLAGAYIEGVGVKKDLQKGLELLEKSADKKGADVPKLALAKIYSEGLYETKADKSKALYWANRAKEEGSPHADKLINEINSK